jgi:hypothetical protein
MGMLTKLLLLPIKVPVDGALWVTGKIAEAANAELNDPAALRQRLIWLEAELMAGRLSEEDYDAEEERILERLRGAP